MTTTSSTTALREAQRRQRPTSDPVGAPVRARTWWWLAVAVLLGLALRLPFLTDPLEPDEAGFLLVARQWHLGDATLYGHYWVDRPPLILLLFKVAGLVPGDLGVRTLGCVAVVALVTAAWVAARAAGGVRAARAGAFTAAALGSSFALGAHEVDGELLAAPLVMAGCAAALCAVTSARRRPAAVLMGLSGASAAAALLVKQNFVDGLVFTGVLLTVMLLRRGAWSTALGRGGVFRLAAAWLGGVSTVATGVAAWVAAAGVDPARLLYTTYGFRLHAAEVIAAGDSTHPEWRLALLLLMGVVSGLLVVVACAVRPAARAARAADPVAWAFMAMLLTGVVGVAGGGSYWLHYLLQLVPSAVIGIAVALRSNPWERAWLRAPALLTASAVVAAGVGFTAGEVTGGPEATAVTIGSSIGAVAEPGDTATVTYGHANVLQQAGLTSPYRYLWSLPARVRDPALATLTRTLRGPRAPTWIVEWEDFDAWGIDPAHRLRDAVADRYRKVATICGHDVFRHDNRPRAAPTGPVSGCADF